MSERQGLAGAGLGIVLPGDILAYRAMWNDYVMQTVCALNSQAWVLSQIAASSNLSTVPTAAQFAAAAPSDSCSVTQGWISALQDPLFDMSRFGTTQTQAQLTQFVQTAQEAADTLLQSWNQFTGSTSLEILAAGSTMLQSFQKTVLLAGSGRNNLLQFSPGLAAAIVQGPNPGVQARLIAQLEGLGIIAGGVLQVIATGIGGAIQSTASVAQWTAQQAKAIVETTTTSLPWIIGGIAVVSAAGVALVYAPEIKAALSVAKAAKSASKSTSVSSTHRTHRTHRRLKKAAA